jgi:hypothetical protein
MYSQIIVLTIFFFNILVPEFQDATMFMLCKLMVQNDKDKTAFETASEKQNTAKKATKESDGDLEIGRYFTLMSVGDMQIMNKRLEDVKYKKQVVSNPISYKS